MVIIYADGDVFADAVCFDGIDDACQRLADGGGVFGSEIFLNALGGVAGLLQGGDDDGRSALILELGKFAQVCGLFLFEGREFFEQCLGGWPFREDIQQVGQFLSDGGKLGGDRGAFFIHCGLMVGVCLLKIGEDVDQVLRIIEELMEAVRDDLFEYLGGDGFGGAGLFEFGSGADVLTVVIAIGLFGGLPVHGAATARAFDNGR